MLHHSDEGEIFEYVFFVAFSSLDLKVLSRLPSRRRREAIRAGTSSRAERNNLAVHTSDIFHLVGKYSVPGNFSGRNDFQKIMAFIV